MTYGEEPHVDKQDSDGNTSRYSTAIRLSLPDESAFDRECHSHAGDTSQEQLSSTYGVDHEPRDERSDEEPGEESTGQQCTLVTD